MRGAAVLSLAAISACAQAQPIEGNILELHYLVSKAWQCSSPGWLLERDLYSSNAKDCMPNLGGPMPAFIMDVDPSGRFAYSCYLQSWEIGATPHCAFVLTRDLRDSKGQQVSVPHLYAVASRRTFADMRRAEPLIQRALDARKAP